MLLFIKFREMIRIYIGCIKSIYQWEFFIMGWYKLSLESSRTKMLCNNLYECAHGHKIV